MILRARTFGYFLREAGRNLSRNGLMALAAGTTIIVSLLIMGVFMIVVTNLNYVGEKAESQIQLRVFLAAGTTPVQAMALRDRILGFREEGVRQVKYISKETAAREFERDFKVPELFSGLDDNPLPDTLQVELERGAKIDILVKRIKAMPGIDEIVFRDFIRTVLVVVQVLWVVGLALILLVCLGVLYIIVNTIRLTVYARRREIEIMKLVGATDWFIRWPFVLEGLILGLAGACLAMVILSKGYYFLYQSVRQIAVIPLAPEPHINQQLLFSLFPAGIFFGTVGSLLSVKKFLKD